MLFIMSFLFLSPVNAQAATVKNQLTEPETGWQRYDDSNELIEYVGSQWNRVISTTSGYYNNTVMTLGDISYPSGTKIVFKFKGTEVRIIGVSGPTEYITANAKCVIDGKTYDYSYKTNSRITQCLLFEFTGLDDGIHTVELYSADINVINLDAIDIDATGYLVDYYQPTNLIATSGNYEINLSWDAVEEATSYNIKRSTTAGGPYETIATSSAVTFTDSDVEPDTTYYYVVSAVVSAAESSNSNEASATPTEETTGPGHEGNYSTLTLTMTNGGLKSHDLSIKDLDDFLAWYDDRSNGTGKTYYVFNKTTSIAPYLSVKEYISFDKISSFEVKEYNE